jgi:hypothetical protein
MGYNRREERFTRSSFLHNKSLERRKMSRIIVHEADNLDLLTIEIQISASELLGVDYNDAEMQMLREVSAGWRVNGSQILEALATLMRKIEEKK